MILPTRPNRRRRPRGHNGSDLIPRHPLRVEVGVEPGNDAILTDRLRDFLRGIPPIHPAQTMRQRVADADGHGRPNRVLTALMQFNRVGGFANALLRFQQPRAQNRHQAFSPIPRPLERRPTLPGDFQKASGGTRSLGDPGRARPSAERRRLVETTHPGRRQRGEMQPMLVVRVEAVNRD